MVEEEAMDDSRRKRDREDASRYREPLTLVDSLDEDSHGTSPKRVKQAHIFADVTEVEDALANSTASPFPVDGPGDYGPLEAHPREDAYLHTSNNPPHAVATPDRKLEMNPVFQRNDSNCGEEASLDLVGAAMALGANNCLTPTSTTGAGELHPASDGEKPMLTLAVESAIAPSIFPADTQGIPVSGWNKGVQSGLRTSFGSRPLLAPSKMRAEDPATSIGPTSALLGDNDLQQGNEDTSSSLPGTNHQESSMFTFGGEASSQADVPYPKAGFKRLPRAARRALPPDEKEAYDKSMAADVIERKEEALKYKTAQADLAIAQEGKWPLPKRYKDVSRWIKCGETFYARIDRKYKGFKTHSIVLDTPRGLDGKGIPIKAQDYSFNIFATAFLASNLSKLRHLNDRNLHLSFQQYCNYWYSHLGTHIEPLLATAKATGAFTLEQAAQYADLPSTSPNSQETSGLQSLVQSHGELSNQGGKEQEDSCHPSHILDEIESRIGVAGSASHMNDPNTVKQHKIFSHQANYIMIEITDGATSGVGEGAPETASRDIGAPERSNDDLELEIKLQRKYFPSISTEFALLRCLACGDAGHRVQECPVLCCTLCTENGKHSEFTCPSKQTCGKCRQRGHQTLNCPEKLFATGAEANGCNICGSENHIESTCHFIWRSFAPQPEEIRTVCNIPVCCYTCGADGHYGPECGLHARPLLSGGYTWSRSNLQKYLDPTSRDRALSAGVDYSITKPKKEFSIKGKGRPNDPFTIEDSDDDDFIRPKIDKPDQRGHIHFAERPGSENSVDYAPTGPRTRSKYRFDNLSYNVAMDSTTPGNYLPLHGSTQNMPARAAPREPSGHFQFSGNQRGQSGGEGNSNGVIRKRKKRNQGGNRPPSQATNSQNIPPPTKPKKKSAAKKRERAAKQAR